MSSGCQTSSAGRASASTLVQQWPAVVDPSRSFRETIMIRPAVRRALIGFAFACGAVVHAAGFVLHRFGIEIYANYPLWRHPTLAALDAVIAWTAFRHPRWLFGAVVGFLFEQIATNGTTALRAWRETGQVQGFVLFMHGVILLMVFGAWGVGADLPPDRRVPPASDAIMKRRG